MLKVIIVLATMAAIGSAAVADVNLVTLPCGLKVSRRLTDMTQALTTTTASSDNGVPPVTNGNGTRQQ